MEPIAEIPNQCANQQEKKGLNSIVATRLVVDARKRFLILKLDSHDDHSARPEGEIGSTHDDQRACALEPVTRCGAADGRLPTEAITHQSREAERRCECPSAAYIPTHLFVGFL